ncbi:FAD-dependent oxidoreductase [Chitinophaga japonensis]|uniref:FAD dependent oxidoreductase n=1 Tax=Chitinophaga japonensis TaxID=104662 RepID=A0A562SLD1_CHIJA|nr:FAD-dependent oxidoreductase [Chitinophaga japonensis]TWI82032.1 FAD dependent oxidoreductase [Chitinophaga japonensis]
MIIREEHTVQTRSNRLLTLQADLVITGGGIAGCCAAITAARAGTKVVLVQDRPVLGGNASSEIRLWILGATSHLGNNNRWSREGGVIDEILIENLYRNKEGNPLILDTILLEKVLQESNITLLLNTVVYEVHKSSERSISSIRAFCSQNSTEYVLQAPFFCDASGDGIVSFLAGAAFRMGAESKEEFGEPLAPDNDYGELLGHSLYFYSKVAPQPVKFVAPAYALKDIKQLPRYKLLSPGVDGCRLWWIEYGGRRDTIYDTEQIKWELWRIVYGVWDYIKNSGNFEDVDHLTLEWVGAIPGKRESRRFEGHYMLTQQDVVNQQPFEDAVAFGGWALDLHPADGVYSHLPGCNQWHTKGVYQIPYRSFISRDIDNLFFAGRIISVSHVAFGSSRVMATCGLGAQAAGMAAALCVQHGMLPRQLMEKPCLHRLQQALSRAGQSIPGIPISRDENDPMRTALITTSSTLPLDEIPFDGPWMPLEEGAGQLLPFRKGTCYQFTIKVKAAQATTLHASLKVSGKPFNYTPDVTLETLAIPVQPGEQLLTLSFTAPLPETQYGFLLLTANPALQVQGSQWRYSGIVSVFNGKNKAVSNEGRQMAPEGSGVDSFEFWCPRRRPEGYNISMTVTPALEPYAPASLVNGFTRPYLGANAWVADPADQRPWVQLQWKAPQKLRALTLHFDTDFDHPLESSLMGHPEDVIPFCVRHYRIYDEHGTLIHEREDNYQTINHIVWDKPVKTSTLRIEIAHPAAFVPAGLFEIQCA